MAVAMVNYGSMRVMGVKIIDSVPIKMYILEMLHSIIDIGMKEVLIFGRWVLENTKLI